MPTIARYAHRLPYPEYAVITKDFSSDSNEEINDEDCDWDQVPLPTLWTLKFEPCDPITNAVYWTSNANRVKRYSITPAKKHRYSQNKFFILLAPLRITRLIKQRSSIQLLKIRVRRLLYYAVEIMKVCQQTEKRHEKKSWHIENEKCQKNKEQDYKIQSGLDHFF